jgi:hypothetical protein
VGERARQFFDEAERTGGIVAKMRLASLAQITSIEATRAEDTPELVARLQAASAKVAPSSSSASRERREGSAVTSSSEIPRESANEGMIAPAPGSAADVRALRRHLATCVELATYRGLFLGEAEALKRMTEAAATAIDCDRASVWFLESGGRKIRCGDLFERKLKRHSAGLELQQKDFAPYFAALGRERTIAAHDAFTDPRTSCFRESYLQPLDIRAMLDVPIWQGGQMIGVVCHEHIGNVRTWNSDEETFAYLVANFVALALDRRQ